MATRMEVELASEAIAPRGDGAEKDTRIMELEAENAALKVENADLKAGWARDKAQMAVQFQGLLGKLRNVKNHVVHLAQLRKDKKKKAKQIDRKTARGDMEGAAITEEEFKELADALHEQEKECVDMIQELKAGVKDCNDTARAVNLSEQIDKQLHFA